MELLFNVIRLFPSVKLQIILAKPLSDNRDCFKSCTLVSLANGKDKFTGLSTVDLDELIHLPHSAL